jgi:hypothetical protein
MNSQIKVFSYNGSNISFNKGDEVMVNATEMAKPFGKSPKDFLKTEQTKRFIEALSEVKKILSSDLVRVVYGDNGGTWMHEDVALEFARWLSPAFSIWCNDRIKELLTVGMTATPQTLEDMVNNPDLIISLATQLKKEREEKENLRLENEQNKQMVIEKTIQLDESMEWYSIKRWAQEHNMDWRKINWRKLKALSYELGYDIKKVFDANYGQVNIYNVKVFEAYL